MVHIPAFLSDSCRTLGVCRENKHAAGSLLGARRHLSVSVAGSLGPRPPRSARCSRTHLHVGPGRWLCRCDRVQRADRSPSPVSSPFVTKCSSLVASDLDTQLAAANGVAAALWSACDRSPLPAAVTAGPTEASVPGEGREKLGTTDELSPPAETPVPRPAPARASACTLGPPRPCRCSRECGTRPSHCDTTVPP